jgi:hypothetical protein
MRTVKFSPHILAEIQLLPTEPGGLKGPTPPETFVCQICGGVDQYFELRMDLTAIGSLSPGSTVRVPIRFSRPDYINPLIQVGTEFSLREIGHMGTIGGGKVLEVYDENLAA